MTSPRSISTMRRGSWPVSRVLSWTAIPLGPGLLQGSSHLPASSAGRVIACLLGVAPGGGCRVSPRQLPCLAAEYVTAPCPFFRDFAASRRRSPKRGPMADSSLWPCSSPHGGRWLAVTLPCGARTFLSVPGGTQRLSSQLQGYCTIQQHDGRRAFLWCAASANSAPQAISKERTSGLVARSYQGGEHKC